MSAPMLTMVLLILPNKSVVLQRRTKDAPHAPGKLGTFGGWAKADETPDKCIKREIGEEISLGVEVLNIREVTDFVIPKSKDFDQDRHFYLFLGDVPNLEFKVYEGDGAEAFKFDELKERRDLTCSAQYVIEYVITDEFAEQFRS